MTTPERFRRRQRIEGTLLLILGVFTIFITLYFRAHDVQQRECIADNFADLSATLDVRGDLAQQESENTSEVILAVAGAKTNRDVRAALDRYVDEAQRLADERRTHPLPPFPAGVCD